MIYSKLFFICISKLVYLLDVFLLNRVEFLYIIGCLMVNHYRLSMRPTVPDEIIEAGKNGELVLFIGAGASMLMGMPSWGGLASAILNELRIKESLDYSEVNQLSLLDPKKQLSIATQIENKAFVNSIIREKLEVSTGKSKIYQWINEIGCPCVTTNYDELVSPIYLEKVDGSSIKKEVNRIINTEMMLSGALNEPATVVHLHGAISRVDSMIVTTKDYLEHYDNKYVQEFLGDLFQHKTVLFIGYGLEEAEILEHILRRGNTSSQSIKKRFALQGFFKSEVSLFEKLSGYYEESFGVHLIGFERDQEDFSCLESIVKDWVDKIEINETPFINDVELMDEVLAGE